MKHKLLHTFCLLSSVFCNAQYTWQALPTAPQSYRFDDMFFLTPKMGWAINPNYDSLNPIQYGRIFKTNDGGNTWQKLIDSANTFYRSIGFADSLTGWVGNLADIPYISDTIPLYQTNDGGHTWFPANLPYPHPAGICGISVVTDSIVYAYGRFYGPAAYVKTTDKGATWIYKDMSSFAGGLVDGYFFNNDTGFITGKSVSNTALILSTFDGGTSWQVAYNTPNQSPEPYYEYVWKLSFPSRDTGYASVESFDSATYFLKTTDGGLTWTKKPFIPYYDEEGCGFINNSTGWIGGDYNLPTYKTTDGGDTWSVDSSFGVLTPPYEDTTGFMINRFRRLGDSLMYASGNTIYKLQVNTTRVIELQKQEGTLSNYPNPFKDKTTIHYYLPAGANNTMLEVYNITGENVFSKNIGQQSAGGHDFVFNTGLSAGLYFYSLSSNEFRLTKQMVIIQ